MEELRDQMGISPQESMNVLFALGVFCGQRGAICNYGAAYLAHLADISEEEGVH